MAKKLMICEHSKECNHILHLSTGDTICSHWKQHNCSLNNGYCERDDGAWKCIPYVAPSPEPMPLIPTLKECQEFMTGWKDVAEAYQKGSDLYSWLFNILQARQEAHDQQVRKAFAEKVELRLQEEMHHPELSEWDSGYQKALRDALTHLRAMGG